MPSAKKSPTRAVHLGRPPRDRKAPVNPPLVRASTVLFPTVEEFEVSRPQRLERAHLHYGRHGTATGFALEEVMADLEGGHGCVVASSGLGAIAATLIALSRSGDELLVSDSVYGPVRAFCDGTLARLGVRAVYYDPGVGAGIADLISDRTRLVYLESPGSLTFEVQDVPAIAAAARARGVRTVMDNSWATPLCFRPLEHGVDVCIHSASKYLSGHADTLLGIVVTGADCYATLKEQVFEQGQCGGSEEIYATLRGLRTLDARLARHAANGLALARWLEARPEVARVLHPALPAHPGHALWRRDFSGATGLFGAILAPVPKAALAAMIDGLELFGIGSSWGGYESLCIPAYPERSRSATRWEAPGPLVRFYAGLEDVDDLRADLEAGFERLARVARA